VVSHIKSARFKGLPASERFRGIGSLLPGKYAAARAMDSNPAIAAVNVAGSLGRTPCRIHNISHFYIYNGDV
jgi:hypothetical protein